MKGLEEDGLVRQVAEVRPEAVDGCDLGGDGKEAEEEGTPDTVPRGKSLWCRYWEPG